jgi:hypothetical protein
MDVNRRKVHEVHKKSRRRRHSEENLLIKRYKQQAVQEVSFPTSQKLNDMSLNIKHKICIPLKYLYFAT